MQEKTKKLRLKKLLFLTTATFILGGLYFFNSLHFWQENERDFVYVADKAKIEVEKVTSDEKRYQGLSGRNELCENCGMLFIMPEKAQHIFSMRGMRFDLDFVWILNEKIIDMDKNIPWNYSGVIKSDYLSDQVLELPAGACDRYGFEIGDNVF